MGYELISDISTLRQRETAIDLSRIDSYDQVRLTHGYLDFDSIAPSIVDRRSNGETCATEGCGSPLVTVESVITGDPMRICRAVIHAIKLRSLIHADDNLICIECRVKVNRDGMVSGSIHIQYRVSDGVYLGHPDHEDGDVLPGLVSLISDGKVSYDSETDSVRVEG